MTSAQIAELIGCIHFSFGREVDLQDKIATVLTHHGVAFHREHSLSAADRIDFLAAGGLGIEVKIGGRRADLLRQLYRYAGHQAIGELLVVTSLTRHLAGAPAELLGKPVRWAYLAGAVFQ